MGFEAEAPESLGPGRETTNWPLCQLHPGPTYPGPAPLRDSGFCLLRATPWFYPFTLGIWSWGVTSLTSPAPGSGSLTEELGKQ